MTTPQFFTTAWTWSPGILLLCAAALAGYFARYRASPRAGFFVAAVGVLLIALISPVNALADGYLFSAHMLQHILLLLIVPMLALLSLPRSFSLPPTLRALAHPVVGWLSGVSAMWLWHVPALCDAAVSSKLVAAVQTVSLLALGTLFWWQVLAPRDDHRLSPLAGVFYLFTACTACSVLGILLTFAPVSVCSVYQQPVDRLGMLGTIRGSWGLTSDKDQQLGGLLMWVPMCLIYLSAIFAQLARWFREGSAAHTDAHPALEKI